jgi:hypothetical protein
MEEAIARYQSTMLRVRQRLQFGRVRNVVWELERSGKVALDYAQI